MKRHLTSSDLDLLKKVSYLARRAACARMAINHLPDDHLKRIVSRAIFIQVDSFLDLSKRLKNLLAKKGWIDRNFKSVLEVSLNRLDKDYRGTYEGIRDKVSAHRQEEALDWIIYDWSQINLLSVDVFSDDLSKFVRKLESPLGFEWNEPREELVAGSLSKLKMTPPDGVVASSDSLALTRPKTVGIISCHPDQAKAMSILSLVDFAEILASLTTASQEYALLLEVAWSLLLVDLFSILDNLYCDDLHESLLTKWRNGNYKGHMRLDGANKSRDLLLEGDFRRLRNKFAAHLDVSMPLDEIRMMLFSVDLVKFANYVNGHIDAFFQSCSADIRTQTFLMRNVQLNGVIGIRESDLAKFDE